MFYLFNDVAAELKSKDIFIDRTGKPVFASHIGLDFNVTKDINGSAIPQGRLLVGRFEGNSLSDNQLSDKGSLTEIGKKYCTVMGVQPDFESLAKFITNTKNCQIDVRVLRSLDEPTPA